MTYLFGIGGGSDLTSALLVAAKLNVEEPVIFTSFRPITDANGELDFQKTVLKYTGHPFGANGISHAAIDEYNSWSVIWEGKIPLFVHRRLTRVYGILVAPSQSPMFADCCTTLRGLVDDLHKPVIAVDTGGDCLRGIVSGMGDRDISPLFGGVHDTRDTDTLRLISDVFGLDSIHTYVLGPGSDGETTKDGLVRAWKILNSNTQLVRMLHAGNMAEFACVLMEVDEWRNSKPGSTISNIREAVESKNEWMDVKRRGSVVVGKVETVFLSSYWEVSIRTETLP